MLRPTRKCGPCGFRWPRHGRSSLKRWSGYSRIEGRVMRMARDQDDPKSRLEAPPMQCPRCETRPLADLYVRRDHSPVPSPSLVRSEKHPIRRLPQGRSAAPQSLLRAPKCRVQAFTSRTNHLSCCRNNTVNSQHLEYFGPAQRDRGNARWLESPWGPPCATRSSPRGSHPLISRTSAGSNAVNCRPLEASRQVLRGPCLFE